MYSKNYADILEMLHYLWYNIKHKGKEGYTSIKFQRSKLEHIAAEIA